MTLENGPVVVEHVQLRPVIEELVRTRYCPEDLTLLVDRVVVVKAPETSRHGQAFRLWLTDGVKSIQAVVKYDLHPFLATQTIRDGSYILITKYGLEALRRAGGSGEICVMLISEMAAISHDGRDYVPLEIQFGKFAMWAAKEPAGSSTDEDGAAARDDLDHDIPVRGVDIALVRRDSFKDESLTGHEAHHPGPVSSSTRDHNYTTDPLREMSESAPQRHGKRLMTEPALYEDAPMQTGELLTTKIIGPRVIRNKLHDVLAVVCSIEDRVICRRGMPDQRNLRIVDDSTTKYVQLTVFVDATSFKPEPGTVALFRNVTTHEWDGGSLKAYQRDCAGYHWFFPNPTCVENDRLDTLRRAWKDTT